MNLSYTPRSSSPDETHKVSLSLCEGRVKRSSSTHLDRVWLFLPILILSLLATILNAQSSEICITGESETYSLGAPPGCTVNGPITCTGCAPGFSSSGNSITLTWVAGASEYSISRPTLCIEGDSGDVFESSASRGFTLKNPNVPGFVCPGDNPGGTLSGDDEFIPSGGTALANMRYVKRPSYGGGIIKVEFYADGILFETLSACDLGDIVTYRTTATGPVTITTRILDQCGNWSAGPSKIITNFPSCFRDDPANFSATVSGNGVQSFPEGFLILVNEQNTLSITGVTDFATNYSINYSDGAGDLTGSGTTFSASKKIGKYQITFTNNPGNETCPLLPPVTVFLGGRDLTLEKPNSCPVELPDDFDLFGFPDVENDNVILAHFAGIVKSKYAITVKPGMTLTLGAELILIQGPPVVPTTDNDLVLNFIQNTSYNEFNQVLGQSRNYFDAQGRGLQSQYKNLSHGVMLATHTLYDAQGRPVISTLPAPISASTLSTAQNECGLDQQIGSDIVFGYKSDFVDYDFKQFDLYTNSGGTIIDKESAPDPVANTTPGTLGWYYSTNNGSATGALEKINEPLVAATGYPYSRTLFQRDGSGEALGSGLPGDQMRAGSGHVATTVNGSVPDTDPYLIAYLAMRETELHLSKTAITGNFFQTTALDANGRKSMAYTDKGGRNIMSLYFGNSASPITTSYQFYDDAGRLVASVSPNGVNQYNGSNFINIDKSTYEYNFKGFLLAANEMDAGRTEYVYRRDGSIRFSQNAEQRKTGRYSYTHYDKSGRPMESGEQLTGTIAFKSTAMNGILENISADGGLPDGAKADRVFSFYDAVSTDAALTATGRVQRFVQGSVSYTRKDDYITSYYSYDEQGRVEWMVQDVKNFGVKTIDYRYGPTGAVQEVAYQRGVAGEEFHHYYEYDADGRLSRVFTSPQELLYNKQGQLTNANVLELQCTYSYYLHGPLKRMQYANNIQGIDYVYTPDGTLKGINSHNPASDPGGDGNDLFGMTIDYYSGDYLSAQYNPGGFSYPGNTADQFGGHIKGTRWQGPVESGQTFAYGYEYDERYQLKDASFKGSPKYDLLPNPYRETIGNYDANGNIGVLNRKNGLGASIADFTYNYAANKNQLTSVTTGGTAMRTYQYNDLGQMTQQVNDNSEALKVAYDVTGKVIDVRNENEDLTATFVYDDRGFRLHKTGYDATGAPKLRTWYIRDASGNVATTYEEDLVAATAPAPTEQPVYGSGKLGLYKPQFGITFYELTDHLGNVRAVIGDKITVNYLATLEDERIIDEQQDFKDLRPASTADFINHTPAQVTVDGITTNISNARKVMRINNAMDVPRNPIGGGIVLWVHPGDKISAEVFAKYANFDGGSNAAVTDIAGYLASTFSGAQTVIDGVSIFSGIDQSPSGVFSALNNVDDNQPKAFLTYLLFDKNMIAQGFDFDQVSSSALIPTVAPEAHGHERLFLENIEIEKEGYIYIYVSNQSDQNMDVYFDDLKVTHEFSDVVAGGDYYPFGLAIEDRQITREKYRYGYQGQFAEKDGETGWNHFELREYDPVIGRWLQKDPAKQYWSPYLSIGNNPINHVDPDGAIGISTQTFDYINNLTNFASTMRFEESATAHLHTSKFGNIPTDFLRALSELKFSADDVTQLLIEMRSLEQAGSSDNTREFANSRFTFNVSDGSTYTVYDFISGSVFVPGSDAAHANPTSGIRSVIRSFNSKNSSTINGSNLVLDVVAHTHNVISPGTTFGGTPSKGDKNYHLNNKVGLSLILNTRNNLLYYLRGGSKRVFTINNATSLFR